MDEEPPRDSLPEAIAGLSEKLEKGSPKETSELSLFVKNESALCERIGNPSVEEKCESYCYQDNSFGADDEGNIEPDGTSIKMKDVPEIFSAFDKTLELASSPSSNLDLSEAQSTGFTGSSSQYCLSPFSPQESPSKSPPTSIGFPDKEVTCGKVKEVLEGIYLNLEAIVLPESCPSDPSLGAAFLILEVLYSVIFRDKDKAPDLPARDKSHARPSFKRNEEYFKKFLSALKKSGNSFFKENMCEAVRGRVKLDTRKEKQKEVLLSMQDELSPSTMTSEVKEKDKNEKKTYDILLGEESHHRPSKKEWKDIIMFDSLCMFIMRPDLARKSLDLLLEETESDIKTNYMHRVEELFNIGSDEEFSVEPLKKFYNKRWAKKPFTYLEVFLSAEVFYEDFQANCCKYKGSQELEKAIKRNLSVVRSEMKKLINDKNLETKRRTKVSFVTVNHEKSL